MPRSSALFAPSSRALIAVALLSSVCGVSGVCGACGSTASSRASESPVRTRALRVRFVDWRSKQDLALVDQSHTDRAELYSAVRPLEAAGTKVTTDEVLEETLRFFREIGFFERAAAGAASAAAGAAQSIEVETPEGIVHMDLHRASPAKDAEVFRQCRDNFAALYNNVYQLQSVDKVPDWDAQNEQSAKKLGLPRSGGSRP